MTLGPDACQAPSHGALAVPSVVVGMSPPRSFLYYEKEIHREAHTINLRIQMIEVVSSSEIDGYLLLTTIVRDH